MVRDGRGDTGRGRRSYRRGQASGRRAELRINGTRGVQRDADAVSDTGD